MSVNFKHKDYYEFSKIWKEMRDVVKGKTAIKNSDNASIYLPPLSGHYKDDNQTTNYKYNTYLEYASFYEATGRTLDGMIGLVYRKVPAINLPDSMENIKNDIDLKGNSVLGFSQKVFSEVIEVGRVGILIDYPKLEDIQLTKLQIEQQNVRPYTSIYKTESIINWKVSKINNINQLSMIVLEEVAEIIGKDEFDNLSEIQYRVLDLILVTINSVDRYVYRQRIFKEKKSDSGESSWIEVESWLPKINGEYLNYIPFFSITNTDSDITPELPILSGVANLNISHYRNSANLENGLIWTGNPTPWVAGLLSNENEEIRLGSSEALLLDINGKAGYMEFTGQGLNPIRESMKEKENMMAVLGSRILAPEKKAAEAAETESIRRAGEQGILSTIANNVSGVLTKILKTIAEWELKDSTDVSIVLNTDYIPVNVDSETMISLLQMYQAKIISLDVLRWNLRQGEVIPNIIDNKTIDSQLVDQPPENRTLNTDDMFE